MTIAIAVAGLMVLVAMLASGVVAEPVPVRIRRRQR